MIRDNEQEHVDALTATVEKLGGKPKRPEDQLRRGDRGRRQMVLETAATVENLGAAAYLGQAGPDQVQGNPRGRPGDPPRRGSPRGGPQHGRGQDHRPRRRLRQAGLDGRGPAEGQAVPRLRRGAGRKGELQCPTRNSAGPRAGGHRRSRESHRQRVHRARRRRGRCGLRPRRRSARSWVGALAQDGGGDVDDPELRAHARVPRGRVLHAGAQAGPTVCRATSRSSPRRSATTRRSTWPR